MSDFISYVKSTIDKAGVDIAAAVGDPTLKFVDLDDSVAVQTALDSKDPAIVWEILELVEDPVDPLWRLHFGIGAKTTDDPGNYNLATLLDAVNAVMAKRNTLEVYDFSPGGDEVTKRGYIYITDIGVDPQLFDRTSGIRLISVSGRAVNSG